MKTRTCAVALLTLAFGSAYAGTFTSIALLSSNNYTTVIGSPTLSAVADVNAPLTNAAFFALSGTCGQSGSGTVSGKIYITATFNLHWKQSTVGEALPTTLYHHHTVDSNGSSSWSCDNRTSGCGSGSSYSPGGYSEGSGYDFFHFSGGSSGSAHTTNTGSFTPSWTLIGTDSNGLSTYSTNTPLITSGTLYVDCGIATMGSAMASAISGATDNFYFDVV